MVMEEAVKMMDRVRWVLAVDKERKFIDDNGTLTKSS